MDDISQATKRRAKYPQLTPSPWWIIDNYHMTRVTPRAQSIENHGESWRENIWLSVMTHGPRCAPSLAGSPYVMTSSQILFYVFLLDHFHYFHTYLFSFREFLFSSIVAANEHQDRMKSQENRDRRKCQPNQGIRSISKTVSELKKGLLQSIVFN